MSFWIVLASMIALEMYVLRRLRFDGLVVAIVLAGTALCANYLTYTSVSERNYDGSSHIEYIQFIADHWRVPDSLLCGVCGHPPLYYALAAVWSKVLLALGWLPYELGIQWLSLLLWFGFVVFALLILRSSLKAPAMLPFAAALVVFWPSSIINSVRVHNDALASLLMLAAIYFAAEWDRRERPSDFYAALAASALALGTKSSGYAVALTLVFFATLRLYKARNRDSLKKCATAVVAVAAATVLAFGLRESGNSATFCQTVLGSAGGGRYVPPVPDTLGYFIRFDALDFVRRMDTVPGDSFLNRFVKSSLFGVMPLGEDFRSSRDATWAATMSALLLGMVILGLGALPLLRGVPFRKYRVYLGSVFVLFVSLVAFRLRLPNEFHEDFRHIYPVLVPLCLGYALIVERLGRSSKLLQAAGVAFAFGMITSSIAFFARAP